jgi:hypothetical protein
LDEAGAIKQREQSSHWFWVWSKLTRVVRRQTSHRSRPIRPHSDELVCGSTEDLVVELLVLSVLNAGENICVIQSGERAAQDGM